MKSTLVVSYHDKTPVAASAAAIASGALYLAYAVFSLVNANGVFSLDAAASIAAFLAYAGLGALLLTVAKYDQRWACIPLLVSAAASAAFTAEKILGAVKAGGVLPIISNITGALLSLVILALAVLLILTVLDKYFSKRLPLILCGIAATLTLADLMLALILGADKAQSVIFFLAGLAAAAALALVTVSMQPGEYVVVKAPSDGPLFGFEKNAAKICPSCGKKAGANVLFCRYCGTKLLNQSETSVKACPDCGYEANGAEMEYCVKCGSKLIETLPIEAPVAVENAPAAPQAAETPRAGKAAVYSQPVRPVQAAAYSQPAPSSVQPVQFAAPAVTPEQAAARMEKLFDLLGKGIITQEEYDQKRAELIKYL